MRTYHLVQKVFFCFLLTGSLLFAQTNLTLESLLSHPFPSQLSTSQEGEKIAWVYNEKGVRNIWIKAQDKTSIYKLTDYQEDDGQEISNLVFGENSDMLFYVRGGAPNRRGEIPNSSSLAQAQKREIWKISTKAGSTPVKISGGYSPALSPDGKTLAFINNGQVWKYHPDKDLTASQMFHIRGSAASLRWNPNSEQLAFVSRRGTHSFIGIYQIGGAKIQYLSPSVDQDQEPVWSPKGDQIAFLRIPTQKTLPFFPRRSGLGWSIMVADVPSGTVKAIWTSPEGPGSVFRGVSAQNQLFWGKGDMLVFPYEGNGWTQLYKIPASGGEIKNLCQGKFEVQYVHMIPDGSGILFSSNQDDIDRQHLWGVNLPVGAPKQITRGKGIEWAPMYVPSNPPMMLCLASGPRTPAHLAAVNGGKGLLAVDPNSLEDFPMEELVSPEAVVFSGSDGMKIHGQLFVPKNYQEGNKVPALIFFHGGSRRQMLLGFHHRGYYHNAYAFNQYMASKGYMVLSVNYRSGIGYGMEFREALHYGAQGASEFQDVVGAGLFLRNRKEVDADKIALWGGSYGGYLTALGLARAPELFAAGVDIHGVHDWNVVIKNFVPAYQAEKNEALARLAYESSPMHYLDGWKAPVLLIHGDDDRNVPFSETVDLVEGLRKRDVHFEQLIFPDEVHGFLLYKNWLNAFQKSSDFLDRMLKK